MPAQCLNEFYYRGTDYAIGRFRCSPDHPFFENTGPTSAHLLVFPRTAVTIAHEGSRAVVADRNRVMLYNRGQHYRRGTLSSRGDISDWFAFTNDNVADAIAPFDPSVRDRPNRPFTAVFAPSEASVYLRQREIAVSCKAAGRDELSLRDAVNQLLAEVIESMYRSRRTSATPVSARAQKRRRELVEEAVAMIARRYADSLTLRRLADELDVSEFHLSRTFRLERGVTLRRYLDEIRLRAALERLGEPKSDLTVLAFDLGYSSHSHFTSAFRSRFGTTPSSVRCRLRRSRNRQGA